MSAVDESEVTASGVQFLEERNYQAAVTALRDDIDRKPSGRNNALLALAYFHLEDYEKAADSYAAALNHEPNNSEWRDMLELSRANSTAAVHESVPDVQYFERDRLLAGPQVPMGSLPLRPAPAPRPGLIKRMRKTVGNGLGATLSVGMDTATFLWGRIVGYRDRVWTNWYRKPVLLGILSLSYMRELLNKHNLKDTYPQGSLTAFVPRGMTPPEGVTHFRTADGSWNNLENPMEGAAGTRFPRNVEVASIRPEKGERLLTPNPREISRTLLTRNGEMKEIPFLNMLAASWIQFQNDDWITHGETLRADVHEIPFSADDPARKRYWQTKILVGKTQEDPTRMEGMDEPPVTFINEVTHWWDGSQIYGSDQKTVDRLRSHEDGKLRLNEDGTLPHNSKGIEETGMVRNWWVGLTMLHTLFAREHNAICDRLKEHHPDWDDNRLFNVARLINAAVTAKIHTVEWTPAVLPNPGLDMGLNANWYGVLTNLFKVGKKRKTVASINVRNPELGGVVGNPINKHGVSYGLTQEFVEVYRLHSFLPERLKLRKRGTGEVEQIPFAATRQAGSGKLTKRMSMGDLFYSFGNQHPGQLVLNNYPKFMQELSIPGNPLYDMGAVDILRARERGVPRYNEFRRQLGLNPITSFEDLTNDTEHVRKLKEVYGSRPEDVEKLDLLIGTLGEGSENRPIGFGFGETMFQIFILNATRRLQADRFYTDCYSEEYYTKEGLEWIDDADLKTVILRHYPELANTGLANIKNAFEPWDIDARLDSTRHPLRAYDKELKRDPWRGNSRRTDLV
jgi:hypothetical protein